MQQTLRNLLIHIIIHMEDRMVEIVINMKDIIMGVTLTIILMGDNITLVVAQKHPVLKMVAIIVALLLHIRNHTMAVTMVAATMVNQIKDALEIFAHSMAATIVDYILHIHNIETLLVHLMAIVERSF